MAKDDKSGSRRSKRDRGRDKTKPPTKVVIRHLPPSMTEEEFLKQIDPLPPHDFYYFAEADWSLGFDATCRAYITFKNYDDVFLFRDRFDGYEFLDNKGNEYVAIVEFASFQGFLKNKSRNSDNKVNTIEEEQHFQQFLKKIEDEREAISKGGETKIEFSLDSKKDEITSTPLLQYLATKREKRRDDAKKRSAEKKRRREEEKEKRKQNQTIYQPIKLFTEEKNNKKSEKVEPKSNQIKEEPKNARARRKELRNRMRHEAYLQKKQSGYNSIAEKEGIAQSKKDNESQRDTKSCSAKNMPNEILKKSKAAELTESVRNFIFTAASNIPTDVHIDRKTEAETECNETNSTEGISSIEDKLSKIEINKKTTTEEVLQKPAKEANEHVKREQLTQEQIEEKREERRIRNKDRPSIAIYQPKARLRLYEENDCNSASKDLVRSNSPSDGEPVKKDDQTGIKKVQRYSERSKSRKTNKENVKEETNNDQYLNNELCHVN